MKLPRIITHANYKPIFAQLTAAPPDSTSITPEFARQTVVFECPLGELCDGNFAKLLLLAPNGVADVEVARLTGREGFNAQGLEGLARCHIPLAAALLLLDRGFIPHRRGRIITSSQKGRA